MTIARPKGLHVHLACITLVIGSLVVPACSEAAGEPDVRYQCMEFDHGVVVYRNDLVPKDTTGFLSGTGTQVPWSELFNIETVPDQQQGFRYEIKYKAPFVATCNFDNETFELSFSVSAETNVSYGFEGANMWPTLTIAIDSKTILPTTDLDVCRRMSPDRSGQCAIQVFVFKDHTGDIFIRPDKLILEKDYRFGSDDK